MKNYFNKKLEKIHKHKGHSKTNFILTEMKTVHLCRRRDIDSVSSTRTWMDVRLSQSLESWVSVL